MGSNTAKEELQLARSTVWYWLNFLEKEGQVVLQKNAKYTVVTIPKWEEYQHDLDADETLAKRKVDTYKNEKNMKNNTSEKTFLPGKQEYEIVEEDAKPKRERIVPTSPSSVVDKWNSYPNWKALKRVGTPPNPSAVEKLLPTARNTMDIRGAIIRKRTKYTEAEFNTAIENYVLEILNRKQDKSTYYAHRFTLYEFLVNKDVFEKYVNR